MKLQTTSLKIDDAMIHTSYLSAVKPREDGLVMIVLHGAGQSNTERYNSFSQFFAGNGIPVVALDFIGHGKTGGNSHDNSLELRTKHALAVIEHWTDPQTPLILCGSSMSGHTALRVAAQLGPRVQSLCLLQPAVYAAKAEQVHFGPEFTKILHETDGWQTSLALMDAKSFTGKAYVAIGTEDKVIPWGVIAGLTAALKEQASDVRLDVIGGVGHELPTWIPHQAHVRGQLLTYLAEGR